VKFIKFAIAPPLDVSKKGSLAQREPQNLFLSLPLLAAWRLGGSNQGVFLNRRRVAPVVADHDGNKDVP